MKKNFIKLILLVLISNFLFAHTAMMRCMDNNDETILCEAGFSDGSSAQGVSLLVIKKGKVIFETKFDDSSEITFKKPKGKYTVLLDGGTGHSIRLESSSISN